MINWFINTSKRPATRQENQMAKGKKKKISHELQILYDYLFLVSFGMFVAKIFKSSESDNT